LAGKHGKYAYVARSDNWYVKVRVLKKRDESDPGRYVVVGFKTRRPPATYPLLKEEELPEEARRSLYMV